MAALGRRQLVAAHRVVDLRPGHQLVTPMLSALSWPILRIAIANVNCRRNVVVGDLLQAVSWQRRAVVDTVAATTAAQNDDRAHQRIVARILKHDSVNSGCALCAPRRRGRVPTRWHCTRSPDNKASGDPVGVSTTRVDAMVYGRCVRTCSDAISCRLARSRVFPEGKRGSLRRAGPCENRYGLLAVWTEAETRLPH